jgi:hypothetical protein
MLGKAPRGRRDVVVWLEPVAAAGACATGLPNRDVARVEADDEKGVLV